VSREVSREANQDLTGQVVVVTGGGRGIGAGLARSLAARGAQLAVVDLDAEDATITAKACGARATGHGADVADQAAISAVMDDVRRRHGRIDAVVVNAGLGNGGTLRMADPATYDRVVEVNLLGSIRTARAALPHLIDSRGYLLQIASAAALTPSPVMGSYCASKSGVEAFAHCLAGEVRQLGVRVGVAYFTWIDTPMVREADADPGLRAARRSMPWPLNRTYGPDAVIARLTEAVARRRTRTFFPHWLWILYSGRATAPTVSRYVGTRFARRYEEETLARRP
jgi:NAD(P)-dependent dehydrogenase (short-subunit alcohol dehydrogenase family)